ncbi:MAG: hypothetical protein AAF572_11515 [Cyanobacteria bacterium P01_B01_bin.77]
MIIEIFGVAGTGKTTILSNLVESHSSFYPIFKWRRLSHVPIYIQVAVSLFPIWLGCQTTGQSLSWQAINWMIRLQALNYLLQKQARNDGAIILLDQGPIYTLARLLDYGLADSKSSSHRLVSWWQRSLEQSSRVLDTVIFLDAPNGILASRIRNRDKTHRIKQSSDLEIQSFLNRHRLAYKQVIEQLQAGKNTPVLVYNTHRQSLDQIVIDIANQCLNSLALLKI